MNDFRTLALIVVVLVLLGGATAVVYVLRRRPDSGSYRLRPGCSR